MATIRDSVLLVLSPPLLAELAARRLTPCDELLVLVAGEGTSVAPGHYDVVVRNMALPAGVTGAIVVELPGPAGAEPTGATTGEVVALDRLEDLADLLRGR